MYKNPNIAFWLSFVLGPVGYLYVNPAHAAIMIIITIVTGGVGLLVTWPMSFILARKKAEEYNRFISAIPQREQQATIPKQPANTGFRVIMALMAVLILLSMYLNQLTV